MPENVTARRSYPILFSGSGGGAVSPTYAEILRDTYGASEIWPLVNISAGTNIPAFIDSNRDGTLTGWDLQNAAGPVTGTLAPYSDGVNDKGLLYTSSLNTLLTTTLAATPKAFFGCWFKVGSSIWTDGLDHRLFMFLSLTPTANLFSITKKVANNRLEFQMAAAGTAKTVNINGLSYTDWVFAGMSYDHAANEFKAWLQGVQVGSTQASPGAWNATAMDDPRCSVLSDGASTIWDGWGAYMFMIIGSVPTPAQILGMYNDAATAGAD